MRWSNLLPFLILAALLAGCSTSRNSARYGWLRKQGEVPTQPSLTESMGTQTGVEQTPTPTVLADLQVASYAPERGTPDQVFAKQQGGAFQPEFHSDKLTNSAGIISDPDTAYYSEQDHRWNAKAIASLPLAITTVVIGIASQSIYLLLIGGGISFAIGLIGSRQCRDREDRGKGFAIAGMTLGAAALFFSLMVLIWAA